MNRTSLLDRIHAAMLESARPWTASELARAFLKLTGDGPAPEALIRSLLAPDTRFAEAARKHAAPPLARDRYLLSWVETGNSSAVDGWRLHLRPHHAEGGARPVSLGAAGGPEAFDEIRRRWEDLRLATFQPGALGRFRSCGRPR